MNPAVLKVYRKLALRGMKISEDQFKQMVYDLGVAWLNNHFGKCPFNLPKWEASKHFWQWFNIAVDLKLMQAVKTYGQDQCLIKNKPAEEVAKFTAIVQESIKELMQVYPTRTIINKISNPQAA